LTLGSAETALLKEILGSIKANRTDISCITNNVAVIAALNSKILAPAVITAGETHAIILGKLLQPNFDKDSKGIARTWALK